MSTWQRIETAPKDGTPLLVKYVDGTTEEGVFWQSEGRCCMLGSRAGAHPPGWTSVEAGWLPVDSPTHWMPLIPPETDPTP